MDMTHLSLIDIPFQIPLDSYIYIEISYRSLEKDTNVEYSELFSTYSGSRVWTEIPNTFAQECTQHLVYTSNDSYYHFKSTPHTSTLLIFAAIFQCEYYNYNRIVRLVSAVNVNVTGEECLTREICHLGERAKKI